MGSGLATGRGIRLGRRTCPRRAGLERQKSVVAIAALHQLQWKGWAETREGVCVCVGGMQAFHVGGKGVCTPK